MFLQYSNFVLHTALAALFLLASAPVQGQSDKAAQLFKRGMGLRARGDLAGALEHLRQAAAINPDLSNVHREIGLILLEHRDFNSAAVEFRNAITADPADYQSRYNLALSLANTGQTAGALREARQLVRTKPRAATGFYALGHIYTAAGDTENAIQALQTATSLDPKLFRAWFELGKLLEDGGDREGAVKAYQSAIRAAPGSPSARYRLAAVLQKSGNRDAAATQFAAAREIQERRARGEQAAAAYRQGIEHLNREEYESALANLSQAAGLRPDFAEIRSALAEAHEQWAIKLELSADVARAIEQYRSAIKIQPSAETQNHLGVLLANSGQIDAAIESFRAALALNPAFQNAEKNLRQAMLLKEGKPY